MKELVRVAAESLDSSPPSSVSVEKPPEGTIIKRSFLQWMMGAKSLRRSRILMLASLSTRLPVRSPQWTL